ncbi:MAG: hypothetical protein HQL97_02025 [Magnetococcales bacterium]|nr:hypothetical protein [Magnetococcales bacterium]MBF0260602.1 hypothetical protein [Magnetococcales bacterium]
MSNSEIKTTNESGKKCKDKKVKKNRSHKNANSIEVASQIASLEVGAAMA